MNDIITKLNTSFIIFISCLLIISVLGTTNKIFASESEEFIFFRQEGAFSPFKFIELSIKNNGSGITKFDRGDTDKGELSFNLNKYELEMLKTLVYTVNFFEQTDKGNKSAIDLGQSTLRI